MFYRIEMMEVLPNIRCVGNDGFNHIMFKNTNKIDSVIRKMFNMQEDECVNFEKWVSFITKSHNEAFIDENTGEYVPAFNPFDDTAESNDYLMKPSIFHPIYLNRIAPIGKSGKRQLKKLYSFVEPKEYNFNNQILKYIPAQVVTYQNELVSESGNFINDKFKYEFPAFYCTSYENLKNTLDRIIITNRPRSKTRAKDGLKAYQRILSVYKELTEQNPEKKYFVEIYFC